MNLWIGNEGWAHLRPSSLLHVVLAGLYVASVT